MNAVMVKFDTQEEYAGSLGRLVQYYCEETWSNNRMLAEEIAVLMTKEGPFQKMSDAAAAMFNVDQARMRFCTCCCVGSAAASFERGRIGILVQGENMKGREDVFEWAKAHPKETSFGLIASAHQKPLTCPCAVCCTFRAAYVYVISGENATVVRRAVFSELVRLGEKGVFIPQPTCIAGLIGECKQKGYQILWEQDESVSG
jgi:hypothetical protein